MSGSRVDPANNLCRSLPYTSVRKFSLLGRFGVTGPERLTENKWNAQVLVSAYPRKILVQDVTSGKRPRTTVRCFTLGIPVQHPQGLALATRD